MAAQLLDLSEYAYIEAGSWVETVPLTVTRTKYVSGLVNQRKRYTKSYATISVNLLLTLANWDKLRTALNDRGAHFTPWRHPFKPDPISCRITSEVVSTPIEMSDNVYEYQVKFTLEYLQ